MAETLLSLRTLVRDLVGDPLEESNSWDDTMVNAAINFAVLNYCDKTDCSYTEETISFSSGIGAVPNSAAYIRVERIIYNDAALYRSDKDFEDMKNPAWRGVSGTPKRFVVEAGGAIRITPSDTGDGSIGYISKPTDLAADGDTVSAFIPEPHHPYLKFAAASWLYAQDGDQNDLKKAQEFMQTFNSLIGVSDGKQPAETKE